MNCSVCGKQIKNQYYWKGALYGRTCWVKYALPELLEEQQIKDTARVEKQFLLDQCLIQVLAKKNLKRIKNSFKLQFIPSVIEQFQTRGYISQKQRYIALDLLSNKDFDAKALSEYQANLITLEHCQEKTGFTKVEIEEYII